MATASFAVWFLFLFFLFFLFHGGLKVLRSLGVNLVNKDYCGGDLTQIRLQY